MSIKDAKNMGGAGVILYLLGGFPRIGFLLRITGIILILIAIYQLANTLKNSDIFNKFLIGFIIGTVGAVFALLFFIFTGGWALTRSFLFTYNFYDFIRGVTSGIVVALLIFYATLILSFYFYKESFYLIYSATQANLFKTAGDLLFYGSILTIILVGFLITFAGWIVLAVAFFTLPEGTTYREETLPPSESM